MLQQLTVNSTSKIGLT